MTVSDLTESELIARIQQRLPPAPAWVVVGIGDDAAVVEAERNRLDVLTVDALVEGVHFDRRFTPAAAIGHRALAVNLSDLAAMGAAPRLALLSCALPTDLPCADFDAMVSALAALAAVHKMHVVGGNLTRSPGPLMIDVTVVGTVKPRRALTRRGARPGDELYVSGSIGGAAAGLQMLREDLMNRGSRLPPSHEASADRRSLGGGGPPAQVCLKADATEGRREADARPEALDPHVRRYLYPEPRVRLGMLLGRNRAASACVDLSDGLADGVWRIADASAVGAVIDADALPLDPCARVEAAGVDPVLQALTGGDDYELLFAARPRLRRRLKAAARHGDAPVTRIGVCTEDRAVVLRRTLRGAVVETPMPRGYTHFR